MAHCINKNHPDFKALIEKSGIDAIVLSAKIGVWMEENNATEWPTLEQLGITGTEEAVSIPDDLAAELLQGMESSESDSFTEMSNNLDIEDSKMCIFGGI